MPALIMGSRLPGTGLASRTKQNSAWHAAKTRSALGEVRNASMSMYATCAACDDRLKTCSLSKTEDQNSMLMRDAGCAEMGCTGSTVEPTAESAERVAAATSGVTSV